MLKGQRSTDDFATTNDHCNEEISPQKTSADRHVLLRGTDDHKFLSKTLCLVRSQIELFAATPEDVKARTKSGGNKDPIVLGQVGIRCIHCTCKPQKDRVKYSTSYPAEIRLVYQAVRNWQRHHFLACPLVPLAIKERYVALKTSTHISSKASVQYWIDSCKKKGLIDTEDNSGIKFIDNPHADSISSDCSANPATVPRPDEATDAAKATYSSKSHSTGFPQNSMLKNELISVQGQKPIAPSEQDDQVTHDDMKDIVHDIRKIDDSEELLLSCGIEPSPSMSPNEQVLEKAKLALETVKAMREIRFVQPPSFANKDTGTDPTLSESAFTPNELSFLGAELYELFVGLVPPSSDYRKKVRHEDVPYLSSLGTSQKKQEKCPENKIFVALKEKGLQLSLCYLVSSLLDGRNNSGINHYVSVEDVEEDLRAMTTQPSLFLFDIDVGSMSGQLKFPDKKLYGRDSQVAALLDAYDRVVVSNGPNELVLVTGHSGAGKTKLIARSFEAQALISSQGASFISGKFDELRRAQPHSAIVSALNEHCDNLAAKDRETLKGISSALKTALGHDAQVVTAFIPSLHKIIGTPIDDPVAIDGKEAYFRLVYLLRLFLSVTTGPENPLVFFLDDLQWADAASLELFLFLATDPKTTSVLFVGSYRENEVGDDHPVQTNLCNVETLGVKLTTIHVGSIEKESVNSLISETLHLLPRLALPLTDIVYRHTSGNPLFVLQFLTSLCDEGLLRFSLAARRWEWDSDAISEKKVADNVAKLMTHMLLKLPPEIQIGLKKAACLGSQFHELLVRLLDSDSDFSAGSGIAHALETYAINEGLISKVGQVYKFAHDQIQNAAYMLIPACDKEALHLFIGRTLWKLASKEELESILFEVVDQLRHGQQLIVNHEEKIQFARISLQAGEKAASASAFLPAMCYLKNGIEVLQHDDWNTNYELCLNLYNSCAETEYILGQTTDSILKLKEVSNHARAPQDQFRSSIILIRSLASDGNLKDAIELGLERLAMLGEPMPSVVDDNVCKEDLSDTQTMLEGIKEQDILQMNEMKNKTKIAAMKLLSLLTPCTYVAMPRYFSLLAFRMVRLSLLHGVCGESAVGFANYGFVLCGSVCDYERGYKYGKLAISLLNRFDAKKSTSIVHNLVYGGITCWTEPLQASLQPLLDGHFIGLSTGSIRNMFMCAITYVSASLFSGKPIGPLSAEIDGFLKQMALYKQHMMSTTLKPLHQAALNLLGDSKVEDPTEIQVEAFSLRIAPQKQSWAAGSLICFLHLWLAYLFEEYELAAEMATKRRKFEAVARAGGTFGNVRMYLNSIFVFYEGLSALALARQGTGTQWNVIAENSLEKMKLWAKQSHWNFQHKLDLLKAEYYFTNGDSKAASKAYGDSIALARAHRFVNEQALAFERAGIFYKEIGSFTQATECFNQSHQCYRQWGAQRKADHVLERLSKM